LAMKQGEAVDHDQKSWQMNNKGMTLIEVLAALVLLALLSTSMLTIFVPPAKWVSQARNQTTAVNYANALLENLRADRSRINTTAATGVAADVLWPVGDQLHLASPANMQATIVMTPWQEIPSWPNENRYDVVVTVSWDGGNERLRSVIRR